MLSFADAKGNLFNRLGALGAAFTQLRTYQAGQLTVLTNTSNGASSELDAEPDVEAIIGGAYQSVLNAPGSSVASLAQRAASAILNRMVYRDNPQPGQTIDSGNLTASLREVIRQMQEQGATVLATTVAGTATPFVGTGNASVVVSLKRPSDGRYLENAFAENVLVVCTADSYTGSSTAGSEPLSAATPGSASVGAFNWPQGSSARANLTAISPGGSNDLLFNGGFETWADGVPTRWALELGTAGTNVSQESTLVFGGSSALAITGDAGSTLTSLTQRFNSSLGTTGALSTLTQYSLNGWLRRDGAAPGDGVLELALVDQFGAIIDDALGTPNSFTVDLTSLSTTYAPYGGSFRTPLVLPSPYFLRVKLTTALTDTRTVYLDHLSLGAMRQLYAAGPYLNVHAGSTPLRQDDTSVVTVTNSRGAGGTLDTFQTLFGQFFPGEIYGAGILLPSSATPTIGDGLII
jgi:hypothetical protein